MLFYSFILGFSSSYLGTIAPSMLNITATKISLEKNKKEAINYAIGVSIIVLFQAFFALLFLKTILNNPFILETIQTASIFVFGVLSIIFFRKALQERKENYQKNKYKGFITGITLSLINMFSIPFYCAVAGYFNMNGWLNLTTQNVIVFVIGSGLGTYFILYNYILLAQKIARSLTKLTKYMNFALSFITGIVALATFIKIL